MLQGNFSFCLHFIYLNFISEIQIVSNGLLTADKCRFVTFRMAIQAVFRSVIFGKLLYASPAWWGFAGAKDKQKVYCFLRLSAWVGFYSSHLPSFDDLCTQADQNLFNKVLYNPDHVLYHLLPPVVHTSQAHIITAIDHAHTTDQRLSHLTDCNFIIRELFYQVYRQYFTLHLSSSCNCVLTVVTYTYVVIFSSFIKMRLQVFSEES